MPENTLGPAIALGLLALYFAPTLVAVLRRKHNALAIIVLNAFLGWTVVGWVAALVWAFVIDPPTVDA